LWAPVAKRVRRALLCRWITPGVLSAESGLDRTVLGLLLVGLLVVLVGVAIAVATDGSLAVAAGDSVADGGSPEQVDPEEVAAESRLSAVERQLADRVASRVRSGSVNISQSDYEQAREALDDSEYESLLDRYSDVAEQTDRENQSLNFVRIRRAQQRYATLGDRYERLHRLYNDSTTEVSDPRYRQVEAAVWEQRDLGLVTNASRSRQIARRMERTYDRLNTTGQGLLRLYENTSTRERDFTEARRGIQRDLERFSETQTEIRRTEFTVLELQASAENETASFVDPLQIEGRFVTVNGTGVGNETFRLQVGEQRYRVQTNATGHFSVAYRPTAISANASSVTVAYVPGLSSQYTSTETNVSISVRQVKPSVRVAVQPESVRYNDTVRVSGWVGIDEVGAGNVSYLVTIDGRFVARNRTAGDGSFQANFSLPASVRDGTRPVRVAVVGQDRALTPTNASTPLQLRSTPTNLSVSASPVQGEQRTLRVRGRLLSAAGDGVSRQELAVTVNGTSVGTVTTGRGGEFVSTVVVPKAIADGRLLDQQSTLSVRVVYDGQGTSLAGSRMQTLTTVRGGSLPLWLFVIVGLLIGSSVVYLLVRGLRRRDSAAVEDDIGGVDRSGRIPDAGGDNDAVVSLLRRARDLLTEGNSRVAIQYGYAAMRARLEREYGLESSQTPWEFYQACRENGIDSDVVKQVRRLTELYEQAVFASQSVSASGIQSSLDSVEGLASDGNNRRYSQSD
jgi:hypothetical protein